MREAPAMAGDNGPLSVDDKGGEVVIHGAGETLIHGYLLSWKWIRVMATYSQWKRPFLQSFGH